ncbi:MAG: cobyrinate a,c-diamide synthase, partial [Chloroflexota bacterium]
SYHRLATGRASRSLDAFLAGEALLPALAGAAASDCELLIVEGVMGLFDGSSQPGVDGSTAAVARLLEAPVVLVIDASAMSGSVAAIAHGFATLDPALRLGGVILNRVGSEGHGALLSEALAPLGIPVLGVLYSDDRLVWRERHLGLVPVAEHPDAVRASIGLLAERVATALDLPAILALARSAPVRTVAEPPRAQPAGRARVAVCAGAAFNFTYPENLELFGQAGAELAYFDPLEAPALPNGCTALYAGGGFPEVFAAALSANRPLLAELCRRAAEGLVMWAECGGFMWLAESLEGHAMAGVLPGVRIEMRQQLTLGYRDATTRAASFLGPRGSVLRGHEFHRSVAEPAGDGLELSSRFGSGRGGFVGPTLFASYLHQHLAATPELAERFVAAAARPAKERHSLTTFMEKSA